MKVILWLSVAIFIGSYICGAVADPDLWWHITVGKWILGHETIPSEEHWNMFALGKPWRAYSWSNEVILALIDRWWGAIGLVVAQLLLAVVLTAVLFLVSTRICGDPFMGALLGAYATFGCFNHFTLRPQVVVWVLFAFSILVAHQIAERGVSKGRLLALAAIGCVWANSHLTAVLGLAAIFLWTLQSTGVQSAWSRALASSAAFFSGTLMTPYLGGEWLTFLAKGGHPLKFQGIAEFQPATILQYSTVFVLLQIVFLVVVAYMGRRLPSLSRAMLAGGMTVAGLTAVKFIPFAVISLCAITAAWWRGVEDSDQSDDRLVEGVLRLRRWFYSLASDTHLAIAFFVLCLAVVNIRSVVSRPVNSDVVPVAAVDFIESHNLEHPILNEFGTGGYLMYRFSDANGDLVHKVSIDGRTNVNPTDVWEMYTASFQGRIGWRKYIDAVKPKTILWRQGSPMVALLMESGEWCRVFASGSQESDFVVFISKGDFLSRTDGLSSLNCGDVPQEKGRGQGI